MTSKRLQEGVKLVKDLGIKLGSRMFCRALVFISFMGKEAVNRRMQLLEKFGFSHDNTLEILRRAPIFLGVSDQKVQLKMDFLVKDVGLDLSYIVRRPMLLMYSVERRLLPRYWLLKVLLEKALLNGEMTFYTTASMSEKKFLQKFVLPYKDVGPGLVDGYALKCSGKAGDRVALQEE